VTPVIAPPYPFISEIERLNPSQRFGLGAQDVYFETSGAHTGEVSLPMVKSVGVEYVIVGHSERRARGETDEEIYKDIQVVLAHKLTVIICVGEKERDQSGHYFTTVEKQIRAALASTDPLVLKRVVIAYEPIWAIGTGNTATASDAHEMKLFIHKVLSDMFGRGPAARARIIYGGSVNKKNAAELLQVGEVDGFLIGGASLKAAEFISIITTAEEYAKKIAKTV
jgi:triosephosphate isomerase